MKLINLTVSLLLLLFLWNCKTTPVDKEEKIISSNETKVDTTLINQVSVKFDTSLIMVMDEMIYLSPAFDIENSPFKSIPLELPLLSDSILYCSYWIGTGQQAEEQYKLLEQTVPPEWSFPSVSIPLGAYALGKIVALPEGLPKDINLMFGNIDEINRMKDSIVHQKTSIPEHLRAASVSKRLELPSSKQDKKHLLLHNSHRTNGFNVNCKIVAVKIKKSVINK